jgi:hypothetical protein
MLQALPQEPLVKLGRIDVEKSIFETVLVSFAPMSCCLGLTTKVEVRSQVGRPFLRRTVEESDTLVKASRDHEPSTNLWLILGERQQLDISGLRRNSHNEACNQCLMVPTSVA